MRDRYAYLAAPYVAHPAGLDTSFEETTAALIKFHAEEIPVYSPITQWHHVAQSGRLDPQSPYWNRLNEPFLNDASALVVLTLEGWHKSEGVRHEKAVAARRGIPTFEMTVGLLPMGLKDAVNRIKSTTAEPIRLVPKPQDDPVNSPAHYQGRGLEAIDVIEAFGLDYHLGSALKYLLRAGKKGDAQTDLQKLMWFVNRAIEKRT